jgi:hypothetical protein
VSCPSTCTPEETCSGNECVCTETQAQACTRLNLECGAPPGGSLNTCLEPLPSTSCGTCAATETCQTNKCVCTETPAQACTRLQLECGAPPSTATNNCGEQLPANTSCGTCGAPETCQDNECVVPCTETACTGRECGMVQSSCSTDMIICGTCTAPETCQNSICEPCTETACAGRVCGTVQSSCSTDMIICGPCNGTCSQDGGTCTPLPTSDSGM